MKKRTRGAMIRRIAAATAGALALAAPAGAVTLVSQDGTPVGGQWQQWADAAKVPTIAGNVIFSSDPAFCGYTWLGCSTTSGPDGTGTPEIGTVPGSLARSSFNFELGHQFDWHYLTNSDRVYLAKKWGLPHWHWWDRNGGTEDGLEAVFALVYADCAVGQGDKGDGIGAFSPGDPMAWPTINSCVTIDRIARRVGADPASVALAPWNQRIRLAHPRARR